MSVRPPLSGTLWLPLLRRAQQKNWAACVQILRVDAASNRHVRAFPLLPSVLSELVAHGHWREVVQLEASLVPTESEAEPTHDLLCVLLDAATCEAAVAACEPPIVHSALALMRRAAANGSTIDTSLLEQAARAWRTWQQEMDAGTMSPALRQVVEEGQALTDARLRSAARVTSRADAQAASLPPPTATPASLVLAELPFYAKSLLLNLRSLSEGLDAGARAATKKDAAAHDFDLFIDEVAELFTSQCDEASALSVALALYAHTHHEQDAALSIPVDGIQWAAALLLAALPADGQQTPVVHATALILATTLLRTLDSLEALPLSTRALRPFTRLCGSDPRMTKVRYMQELCRAVTGLQSTAPRDGGASVWLTLRTVMPTPSPARHASSLPSLGDAYVALTLTLLTDAVDFVWNGALAQFQTSGEAELEEEGDDVQTIAALASAVTTGIEAVSPAHGRRTRSPLAVTALTRLWTTFLGAPATARLCPAAPLAEPSARLFSTENQVAWPLVQETRARAQLWCCVLPQMQTFHAWMCLSAHHLDSATGNAAYATFSTVVHARDAEEVPLAQAAAVLLSACKQPSVRRTTHYANMTDAVEEDDDEEDAAQTLLSGGNDRRPLPREVATTATVARPVQRASTDTASSSPELPDKVVAWYARLLCLFTGPSAAAPRHALMEAAPSVFARDSRYALRVVLHVALQQTATAEAHRPGTAQLDWQRLVGETYACLCALPTTAVMMHVSQSLAAIPPPPPSRTHTNSASSHERVVEAAAVVLRLAGTAALQHPRSNLSLDDKARVVRACLASFPAKKRSKSGHEVLTASEAALLLVRCDTAAFQTQHEASKALVAVLGTQTRLEDDDDDDDGHATVLAASTSSLEQVLHRLVECTQPPRWADALAVVAEASLSTTPLSPVHIWDRTSGAPEDSARHARRVQIAASVLAAERGTQAVPLYTHSSRHAEADADDRLSLATAAGTPLSAAAHEALREELKPLRAKKDVKAAIQIFYRLERQGKRLSLTELEWFAFAVKRGPLVFAVRVLAYLGGDAHGVRHAHAHTVTSRSLGMAAVQCAANVYMRERLKSSPESSRRVSTSTSSRKKGSRHASAPQPHQSQEKRAALQLVAYECRIVAAQGVQRLPRHTGDEQRHSPRQSTSHRPTVHSTDNSASRFLSSLEAGDGDDASTQHAQAGMPTPTQTSAQDFQRLVTAARRLWDSDVEATRLFLVRTGAFTLLGVQAAVEELMHTIAFCVDVADRDTAMRAYVRFRESWATAPVPRSLLVSLLQLECDWAADTATATPAAPPRPVSTHNTQTRRQTQKHTPSTSRVEDVATKWSASAPTTVPASAIQPPPPPSLPLQVRMLLRDGMQMATEASWAGVSEPAADGTWASPLAAFLSAALEVIFSLRAIQPDTTRPPPRASTDTPQARLAAILSDGGDLVPTAVFASFSSASSSPPLLVADTALYAEVIALVAHTLTRSADVATVLEGTSVLLGAVLQRPAESAKAHTACTRLLQHVGQVLHTDVAPSLYVQGVENALGPRRRTDTLPAALLEPSLCVLAGTEAAAYQEAYDAVAGAVGLRTFHSTSVQTPAHRLRTPLANALCVAEQLHQLAQRLHQEEQRAIASGQSAFVALHVGAHMAMDAVHTALSADLDTIAQAPHHVLASSAGLWFDTCLQSFSTCVALVARVDDVLQDERTRARLVKDTTTTAGAVEAPDSALAQRGAVAHMSLHLEEASRASLLTDLQAWWHAVEALDRHDTMHSTTAWWAAAPRRRQQLLWLLTTLCRMELPRRTSAVSAERLDRLARVIEPVQRALVQSAAVSEEAGATSALAADERLVVDALTAFCDLRHTAPRAAVRRVSLDFCDAVQTDNTAPVKDEAPVSLLLWSALPIVLHVQTTTALSGSAGADMTDDTGALACALARDEVALRRALRHYSPAPGAPALQLPSADTHRITATVQRALWRSRDETSPRPVDRATVDALLSAELLDTDEARFALSRLSGTVVASEKLSPSFFAAACAVAVCEGPQLALSPATPGSVTESRSTALLTQLSTHDASAWPLAKYLVLNIPFVCSHSQATASVAAQLADRLCVALSCFGPWPTEVLAELASLLAQATDSASVAAKPPCESVCTAWRLLEVLLGESTSVAASAERPYPTVGTSPSDASASAALFALYTRTQAARRRAAGLWSQGQTHAASPALLSLPTDASAQIIAIAETVLNKPVRPAQVVEAASARVPQRALMDASPAARSAAFPSATALYAALMQSRAVSAARADRRYAAPVPPMLVGADHSADRPATGVTLPTLSSPSSLFVIAAAVKQTQQLDNPHSEGDATEAMCGAQILSLAPRARVLGPQSGTDSADRFASCRFSAAAVVAPSSSTHAVPSWLCGLACAGDPPTFLAALHTADEHLRALPDADSEAALAAPTQMWHATLARLTELGAHEQGVLKRSLSDVHARLTLPALQAVLAICERSSSTAPLASDVRAHAVATLVEMHLAALKNTQTRAGASLTPTSHQRQSLLADASFAQKMTRQLYPSETTSARVEAVRSTLRLVLAAPSASYETGETTDSLFPHSLWGPALWERLLLERATSASEESPALVCVLRHPLVVADLVRAIASRDVVGRRWRHVRRGAASQWEASGRRPGLREASDAVLAYSQFGACAVAHGPDSARPWEHVVSPPYTPGSGCVVDALIALLSEWGQRGALGQARRDEEWLSVLRFTVDSILPAARIRSPSGPLSTSSSSPSLQTPAREARLEGFLPSSWRNLLGLVVDRIGLDTREAPSADYAVAVLDLLVRYADAEAHLHTHTPGTVGPIHLLAWSRQNLRSLLHFFLRTYALTTNVVAPIGWHATRQASVDMAWTTLLSFLSLVAAAGHGTVNLWAPNTIAALVATLALDSGRPTSPEHVDGEDRAMPAGAWLIVSVAQNCSAAAARPAPPLMHGDKTGSRRQLNVRGLQRFFTGSWRRTQPDMDRLLLEWLTTHTDPSEMPLGAIREALEQRGAVPAHATVHALLACAISHTAMDVDDTSARVAWSTWGLALCDCLCPFMAMTPSRLEQILLLFAYQPLETSDADSMGRHLERYLARYQRTTWLTPVAVATLAQLHHRWTQLPQKPVHGDAMSPQAALEELLLCRTVQGLLALSAYDTTWLINGASDTAPVLSDEVLATLQRGCADFLVRSALHTVACDDLFLRAGRLVDQYRHRTVGSPLFTESVCARLAALMEAHNLADGTDHADAQPMAGPLPPLTRLLALYEAFTSDRTAHTSVTTEESETAGAVQWRFLTALLRLSTSAPLERPGGAARRRLRAAPAVSWEQALRLLFPTTPRAEAAPLRTSLPTSLAADALRLLTRASPRHQWHAAVALYAAATPHASPAATAFAERRPTVPTEQTPATGTPSTSVALSYVLLQYLVQAGSVAEMPLPIVAHLVQSVDRLERDAAALARRSTPPASPPLTPQQVHNRRAVLARLAEAVAQRSDVTASTATRWLALWRHLETALPPTSTERDTVNAETPAVPWMRFRASLMQRLLSPSEATRMAGSTPQQTLAFALACGLTQDRTTQRWLVHAASLAAPTRVPEVLALFTPTARESSTDEAAWQAEVTQKQARLRQLIDADATAITAAQTALLSDLLLARPKDGRSAHEAARVCQLQPALLRTDALTDACVRLAQNGHDAKLTLFFTTLLTPSAYTDATDTSSEEVSLATLSVQAVRHAVQSYTRLAQAGDGASRTDATWWRPAVRLVAELTTRLPWADWLAMSAETTSKPLPRLAQADLDTLETALHALSAALLGVETATTVAPLVLFGQPVSTSARAALTPLYAAITSHVLTTQKADDDAACLCCPQVRQTVVRLAAVCVAEQPALAVRLLRLCGRPIACEDEEAGEDTALAVDVYAVYAAQRVVRQSALDACPSQDARVRLALRWRHEDFMLDRAADNGTALAWCAPLSFFVSATAVLGHLDGVRLSHVHRLIALIDRGADTSCGTTTLPCLTVYAALLQWWWRTLQTTSSARPASGIEARPPFVLPIDHLQVLLATVRRACASLPAEPTGWCLSAHWETTRLLNVFVLRMAHAMTPLSGTRGALALGRQLISLLTVLEPFSLALCDTHDNRTTTRQSIASLKEAMWCVLTWTGNSRLADDDAQRACMDVERSQTCALEHSKVLLEHVVQFHLSAEANVALDTKVASVLPSPDGLQRVLVPQLCEDGLALTLASVQAAVRGVVTHASRLDAQRLHLLLSSAALIDEAALLGPHTSVAVSAQGHTACDTLASVTAMRAALSPHVLLRPSEASLALLKVLCVRARGAAWRPLFAQLTGSTAVVSVRPAVLPPEEERAQQARLAQVLADRATVGTYSVAWTIALERRQQGLRLNWPCYAAIWQLAEESEVNAASAASTTSSSVSARWERLESWLHALLRDGAAIPHATTLDALLAYLTPSSVPPSVGAPYVRHLATLLSALPRVWPSAAPAGRIEHAETPSAALVRAIVEAWADSPVTPAEAFVPAEGLRRFLTWYLDFPAPAPLPRATVDGAVSLLCRCRPAPSPSPEEGALDVSALLTHALWREKTSTDTTLSPALTPHWHDARVRYATRLPDSTDVLVALRLLAQQAHLGQPQASVQSWAACMAATGAVLPLLPPPTSEHSAEASGLVQACLSDSHGFSMGRRNQLARILAEQSLWQLDLRALRRHAAFTRPAWQSPRADHLTAPVDKAFSDAVLRHLWHQYVQLLSHFSSADATGYHDVLLPAAMASSRTDPLTGAGLQTPPFVGSEDTVDGAESGDADDDEQALAEVMTGLTRPAPPGRPAPIPPAASTARLDDVAARLQSLCDLLPHLPPTVDLQYPFEVLMDALLQTGRWMEAFAWMESASLTPAHPNSGLSDGADCDAVCLVYASLEASNAETLLPSQDSDHVLQFPADAVRIPSPPVQMVAAHARLEPLLLWRLVQVSQALPAIAAVGPRASAESSAQAARLTALRRGSVLAFAEAWITSQARLSTDGTIRTREASSTSLTWTLIAKSVSAHDMHP